MNEKNEGLRHCCKDMDRLLEDGRLPLIHDADSGVYVITRKPPEEPLQIMFCPWCGSQIGKTETSA